VLSLLAPGRALADPVFGQLNTGSIFNTFNWKCLDADANAGWNGTKVQLWDCNAQSQQIWTLRQDPYLPGYQIVNNRFPGMCLNADDSAGTYPNGARVQLWECHDGWSNAVWRLSGNSNNWVLATAARPDMVLDGDVSQGDVNGMKANMYTNYRTANQVWTFNF